MHKRITLGDSTALRWTTTAAYTPIRRVSMFKDHHSIASGPSDTAQSAHSDEKTLIGGLTLSETISPASTPPAQPPLAAPPAPEASAPVSGGTGEDTGQVSGPDYRALYEETRTRLTRAEQTAREHQAKASKLDEIEAANKTEAEKAVERATAAEARLVALRRTAVDAEIHAAASGWADPTDAPRYLDDRDHDLAEDGTVDTAAIAADLAAVLAQRPHLARVDGPRRPRRTPRRGSAKAGRPAAPSRSAKPSHAATGPPASR